LNRQANTIEAVFRQHGMFTRIRGGRVFPDAVQHHCGWLTTDTFKLYERDAVLAELKRELGDCRLFFRNGTVMVEVRRNAHLQTWTPVLLRPIAPGESRRPNGKGGDDTELL